MSLYINMKLHTIMGSSVHDIVPYVSSYFSLQDRRVLQVMAKFPLVWE